MFFFWKTWFALFSCFFMIHPFALSPASFALIFLSFRCVVIPECGKIRVKEKPYFGMFLAVFSWKDEYF